MIRGLLFGPSLGSIVQHYWDVMELSCIKSWGRFIPPFSSCKGWEAFQAPLGTFGSSLDNCPKYIAAAGGGPFASLHDGNKTTTVVHMHHCMMAIRWQHMCAILYVQYLTYLPPKKNLYSLELIWYLYDFITIANWLPRIPYESRIPSGSTCSLYGHMDLFALWDNKIIKDTI